MSAPCRDAQAWRALLAHRLTDRPHDAAEPAQWPAAAAHLQDCERCQRTAVAIDPTLLFRRLSSTANAAPAELAGEVEAMRAAVAGLRRARALTGESPRANGLSERHQKLLRWAAAAVLVAALGSQLPAWRREGVVRTAASVSPKIPATGVVPAGVRSAHSYAELGSSLGAPGSVGRPQARVYEIADRDMAVIMVVDQSLDL